MIYILIGLISACAGAVLFGILLMCTKRNDEKELELLFRYYDYSEQVRLEKVDAEIAYLESLYGLDSYVRERGKG